MALDVEGDTESDLVGSHVSDLMPDDAVQEGAELTIELLNDPAKQRTRFEFVREPPGNIS